MSPIRWILFILVSANATNCYNLISKCFTDILDLSTTFNLSDIDGSIFGGAIEHKKTRFKNISTQCRVMEQFRNNYTNYVVNLSQFHDSAVFNDFILSKLSKRTCDKITVTSNNKKFSRFEVWIYGLLIITLNNVLPILGIAFVPLMRKRRAYQAIMTFMVSLAIGALAGTSILILIPDSMQISELLGRTHLNPHGYKWKACMVFFGMYFFFITERLMKSFSKAEKTSQPDKSIKTSYLEGINEINISTEANNPPQEVHTFENQTESVGKDVKIKKSQVIAPVAWMIILGDALHNLVDGLSIGAAFSQSVSLGINIAIAVLCEEFPHELGDFAVLLTAGMTPKQAVFWNLISAMTCYFGFICGVIIGEVSVASTWIFALAGGMFLYISLVDMMNDIISTIDNLQCSRQQKIIVFANQNLGLFTGFGVILLLSLYSDKIGFNI